jgi:hypothetical protein
MAKGEGKTEGTASDVCGASGALEASSKVFSSAKHSFLYQQPLNTIMSANKVVILTGASRGKQTQDIARWNEY